MRDKLWLCWPESRNKVVKETDHSTIIFHCCHFSAELKGQWLQTLNYLQLRSVSFRHTQFGVCRGFWLSDRIAAEDALMPSGSVLIQTLLPARSFWLHLLQKPKCPSDFSESCFKAAIHEVKSWSFHCHCTTVPGWHLCLEWRGVGGTEVVSDLNHSCVFSPHCGTFVPNERSLFLIFLLGI